MSPAGEDKGGSGRKRKNKTRMNYLKNVKRGRGGGSGGSSSWGQGQGHERRKRDFLEAGMKGFLLTTNFKEKECVREAYNLLNEYYSEQDDKVEAEGQGQNAPAVEDEKAADPAPKEDKKEDEDNDDDVAAALAKEVKELKSEKAWKFVSVDTGVKNVIFIKTTIQKPTNIVYRIFEDVVAKKEAKCRNILRFLPIEGSCHLDTNSITSLAKEVFTPYFKSGLKTYKILPNIRYSNHSRDSLIQQLAEIIQQINPLNVVKMEDPEFSVIAEVIKGTLCLSVVRDFGKFKKFNIIEIVSPTPPQQQKKNPAKTDCTGEEKDKAADTDVDANVKATSEDAAEPEAKPEPAESSPPSASPETNE